MKNLDQDINQAVKLLHNQTTEMDTSCHPLTGKLVENILIKSK